MRNLDLAHKKLTPKVAQSILDDLSIHEVTTPLSAGKQQWLQEVADEYAYNCGSITISYISFENNEINKNIVVGRDY